MLSDEKRTKELVGKYLKQRNNRWDLANNILYEMCENYPSHTYEDEIVDLYKGYDDEYVDSCIRAAELQEFIQREFDQKFTPREIDTFLLYINSLCESQEGRVSRCDD